jgi:hypothetical protein
LTGTGSTAFELQSRCVNLEPGLVLLPGKQSIMRTARDFTPPSRDFNFYISVEERCSVASNEIQQS